MTRVQRLPEDLVNKIAAGEVVERPASVVKELVENALDAEAAGVAVEIEGGGRSFVRVHDDGCGMSREDALAALERHATSKIRELDDLERIATHGFRGEALPSIASVSHLVLRTRDGSSAAGTEVEVRHGGLVHVRDAGHPRGTTVDVRDLFGAVPARRKFLRADATEASHVADAVTTLAFAHPEVGFSLLSGGRPLVQAPAVDALAARAYQLFGGAWLDEMIGVDGGESWARVRGLVSRADRKAASRGTVRFYVNGRAVRDRALAKAVTEAYGSAGVREARPDVVLFVEVPPHLVDVNVHPAKVEVRFAEPRVVWSAVARAVRSGLKEDGVSVRRAAIPSIEPSPASAGPPPPPLAMPGASSRRAEGDGADRVAEGPPSARSLLEGAPPSVLGQHRNTYIVVTDGEDLLLVDQHTAHERVRFEALLGDLERRRAPSQMLLAPMVAPLPPRLRPALEAHLDDLAALGFDVEPFGGDAVRVRALPEGLGGRDPARSLEGLLEDLLFRGSADWIVSSARHRVAATLACHSAARAGEALRPEAMRAIVHGLWMADQPALCPHGRPTRVRVPQEEVARWFRRTGWVRS